MTHSGGGKDHQLKGTKPATPHTKRRGGFHPGSFLRRCDRSGRVYGAEDTVREWNGLIVGKDEWEPRHPQEFKRGIREKIAAPMPRPEAPFDIGTVFTIDSVTAVSGSVVSSVYTSAAITNSRPFVFWTLDLATSIAIERLTLGGMLFSGNPPIDIRRGVFVGYSDDNVTYTNSLEAVNENQYGITTGSASYSINVGQTARYLRLALIGGAGLGYTGTLTHSSLAVEKGL